MSWVEFFWDVASNTLATVIGVAVGVPVGLWIERRRQVGENLATAARRNEERKTLVDLLDSSLRANLDAVRRTATEISQGRHVFAASLELQTWDVLKPQLVGLVDDPAFVARLAQYFAQLEVFDAMVAQRLRWDPWYEGSRTLSDQIVKFEPELVHHGMAILSELRRFA